MKLYDGGRAPNPRRVQIFVAEKGIEIERVQLDLNAGDQKSAEYSRINPFNGVPVLELDDGSHICETVAICRYLEGICPEPNLMGRDFHEASVIEMWQRRVELNFLLHVGYSFRHLHPAARVLEPVQVAEWGELSRKKARAAMEIIDRELAGREFIAGDRYTIADITAFAAYQFLKPARMGYPEDLGHLNAWYERIKARPSSAFDTQ